jgi:SAM-dependent methyltransferase
MPRARRSHDNTSQVVLPTIAAYERFADEFLSRWERRRYRQPPLLRRWLAHLPKTAQILDLGCGSGQDADELRRRGHHVIGLDRTAALLAFARRQSAVLPLICADMRRLPLRGGSFDGIWAAASLIHLPKANVKTVLADLRRLTRPGGILGATFTHGMKSRILKRGWIPGRYFSRWKKGELERVFHATGWQAIEVATVTGQERKGRWVNVLARRDP